MRLGNKRARGVGTLHRNGLVGQVDRVLELADTFGTRSEQLERAFAVFGVRGRRLFRQTVTEFARLLYGEEGFQGFARYRREGEEAFPSSREKSPPKKFVSQFSVQLFRRGILQKNMQKF